MLTVQCSLSALPITQNPYVHLLHAHAIFRSAFLVAVRPSFQVFITLSKLRSMTASNSEIKADIKYAIIIMQWEMVK